MSEMQIFESPEFGQIRVKEQGGEPWFVAADVCRAVDIKNNRDALTRLDEDEKGVVCADTPGGPQEMAVVNEPGLYALVLGSRKPEAKAFKRWVTHEVIPSIRKTGGYIAGQEEMDPEELMARALTVAHKVLAQREERIAALCAENQRMRPKAEYFDALVERNTLTNFRDTAKEIGASPRAFVNFLLEHHYIYRDAKGKLLPYQVHVEDGLFQIKECFSEKNRWSGIQTLVTPKGRETFRLLAQNR